MRCFLIMGMLLSFMPILAQESNQYLSGMLNYGNVILHSQELRPIGASYPIGISIDYGKHQSTQKVWNVCNCYPRSGVSLTFWDFDNPDVLGYGFSGMYFIQPVFGAKNRISFSLRAAAGLSYQTKPHDEVSNPDNLSYSTYLAIPLQLGVAAHYKLNDQWTLDLQGVLNHISNGGLNEPNKGINWPTVGLGVSRYLSAPHFKDRAKNDWHETVNELNRFDVSTFTTYHSPSSGKYTFSWGVEGKYVQRVSRLSNLSVGAEYFFDNQRAETTFDGLEIHGHNLGLAIGHEFALGRVLFAQQFAVYLIKPESQKNDVFQRYTLVYRINEKLNAGIGLKSHGHIADFGDFRVGINF